MKKSKKRIKASLTFDMNSNAPNNPPPVPKKVGQKSQIDNAPKSPPMDSDTSERGIDNLEPKIEALPLKNLKKDKTK